MSKLDQNPYLGTTTTSIASLIYQFGGFLTYLIIFSFLPPEQSGLYFLVYAFYGLIGVFTSIGFGEVISRYVPFYRAREEHRKASSVLYTSLALNLGMLIIALAVVSRAELVSLYNAELSNAITPAVLFFGLAMLVQNVLIYSMFGTEQYTKQAGLNAFQGLMKPVATYIALANGMGIDGIFLMQGALFLFIDALTMGFIIARVRPAFGAIENTSEILKFGFFSGLNSVMGYVLGWMDVVILGFFTSTAVVAVYGFSVLITRNVIPFVSGMASSIALPAFSRKEGKGASISVYSRPLYIISLYSASFFFFVALTVAPFLIHVFFEQYEEANAYMPLLGIAMVASAAANPLKSFLFAKVRSDSVAKAAFIAAGSNAIMNIALVPFIGAMGASISTAVAMLLYLAYVAMEIRKQGVEVADWRSYMLFGLLAFSSAIFMYDYYSGAGIERVLFHMGALLITLTLYIYFTLEKEEFDFIKEAIKRVSHAAGIPFPLPE
ncbi:MAG: oligosaccharide flippase family protein [Candidatus Anstonellales archaeon]